MSQIAPGFSFALLDQFLDRLVADSVLRLLLIPVVQHVLEQELLELHPETNTSLFGTKCIGLTYVVM